MSHTNGPWKENKRGDIIGNYPDEWDGTPIIECDSGHYGPFGDDRKLILAAPELLEALENAVELLTATGFDTKWHESVLRKAKGINYDK